MRKWKINLLILLSSLVMGFSFVAVKKALTGIDPRALALSRTLCGTLVFLPWALRRWPPRRLTRGDLGRLVLAGLTGVFANQLLFVEGMSRTNTAHAAIIVSSIPVLTLVIAALFRQERLTPQKGAGFLLALGGLYYLIGIDRQSFESRALLGDLMILANSTCYAFYLVIARPLSGRFSAFWVNSVIFFVGLVGLTPFAAGPLVGTSWDQLDLSTWIAFGYVLLLMTAGVYGLVTYLLRYTDASHIAQGIYLQPIVAIAVAYFFLGEPLSPRLLVATVCVLSGVALTQISRLTPASEVVGESEWQGAQQKREPGR